jgi:hypothetical protein
LKAATFAHSRSVAHGFVLVAGALFSCCTIFAQEVAVPTDTSTPNSSTFTPAEVAALQSGNGGAALTETPRRFRYTFSVTGRGVYDDNVNISSFNRMSDFYFAIEPSLFLGFGSPESNNTLSLTYRPSVFLFADNSQFDTVQHLVRVQGTHVFGRLAIALSQNVQILDGADLNSLSDTTGHNANIDVGGRTRHNIYTTALSASYQLTGKLFLSGAGDAAIDQYSGSPIGSKNFAGNLFLNYNYSPKVVIGVGGTGGYNTVDTASPNQTYEQINARLGYNVTAKVNFGASFGGEFRQFGSNGRGTYFSPVYTLGAAYQPFDGTSISLSGSRHTNNSAALAGQDYTSTDIHFAVSQRFLQRMALGVAAGYENANYFSTISGFTATRNDDYYYVEPTVDMNVTRYWSVGAYYLHRQDNSSFAFFSFYDNQVGLRTKVTF